MPLQETLNALLHKQKLEEQADSDKPQQVEEWKRAVRELFQTIRRDLDQYLTNGQLTISQDYTTITEEHYGRYQIDNMKIIAGPATILVQPVALAVIGAWGRVDMYRSGRAGDLQRVMFLRLRGDAMQPFTWNIMMPSAAGGVMSRLPRQRQTVPYTKEALEEALDFLLN